MANISLKHVYKIYPSRDKEPSIFTKIIKKGKVEHPRDVVAVKDFNLEIQDGEFIVFVGPSGCGKSTTLRMIAGLEEISAGELYMGDRLLNNIDPMDRDMAMVFQSYALYPHLSVYDNIAFGLKMRKIKSPGKKVDTKNPEYKKEKQEMLARHKSELSVKEIEMSEQNKTSTEIEDELLILKEKHREELSALNEKYALTLYSYDQEKVKILKEKLEIAKLKKNKELVAKLKAEIKEEKLRHDTPLVKYRHYTKSEIDEKVQWAANILGIKQLLRRKPTEMSGGQCQRVALGRAIVRGPKLFLLDEPLSNLDAKLRTSMRSEIVKLHQRLKTTFIYVTHDQVEAMTMGTRIVVMKDGITQQIDTPVNLFNYPKNVFVAGFIGTPQMDFFKVKGLVNDKNFDVTFEDGTTISLSLTKLRKVDPKYLDGESHDLTLGVRAEHINIAEKGLPLTVSMFEILGSTTQVMARLGDDEKDYIISVFGNSVWSQNQQIHVSFDEKNVHLFDLESGETILGDVQ